MTDRREMNAKKTRVRVSLVPDLGTAAMWIAIAVVLVLWSFEEQVRAILEAVAEQIAR